MPPYHRHKCHRNPPKPGGEEFKQQADRIIGIVREIFEVPDLDVEVFYELPPMTEITFKFDQREYERRYERLLDRLEAERLDVVNITALFDPEDRDRLELRY